MRIFVHFFMAVLIVGLAGAETKPAEPNVSAPSAADTAFMDEQKIYDLTADLQPYEKQPQLTGKIRSMGSTAATTLASLWAESFMKIYPEVTFDIQMGRSTKDALVMMFEGRIDLIPISRPLSRDEIGQFKNKFGYEPTQIGIAFEALGIYVNKNNPVKQLTLQQLDAIFSANLNRHGKIVETWEDLGVAGDLSKRRVLRFNLPSKGSAHIHFRDIVMLGGDYRLDVKIERTAGSLVQAVGANDAGIGFTAVIFATQRTRFVPIVADDGIAYLPTYENVVSGKYPLPRMLNFVINKKPGEALNPVILEYLKFATSRRGQRIIALDGSYPLTPESQKKSRGKFD